MKQNEINRLKINDDVQKFIAAGGVVRRIATGVSGQPISAKKKTNAEAIAEQKARDLAQREVREGRA